jgi:hypothetical protein
MNRRRFLASCWAVVVASPEVAARELKRHEYFLGQVEDGKVTYLATNLAAIPPEFHRGRSGSAPRAAV